MHDRRVAANDERAPMSDTPAAPSLPLAGRHILIVEDEMIVAFDLCDIVEGLGGTSTTVGRVAKAVALAAAQAFDAAVLDLNLAGEPVYPVAIELRRRGIPFIIASGYGADGIAANYRDVPLLAKPYSHEDVESALLRALALKRGSALAIG
jgi:CheY-like chemotaxis protein